MAGHPFFLAPGAVLVGDVTCGPGVNIWFGSVVRGDMAPIILGENVNLQDGVIVHCDFGIPNVIEANVVAGHRALLHGKRIGMGTLVGMVQHCLAKRTSAKNASSRPVRSSRREWSCRIGWLSWGCRGKSCGR